MKLHQQTSKTCLKKRKQIHHRIDRQRLSEKLGIKKGLLAFRISKRGCQLYQKASLFSRSDKCRLRLRRGSQPFHLSLATVKPAFTPGPSQLHHRCCKRVMCSCWQVSRATTQRSQSQQTRTKKAQKNSQLTLISRRTQKQSKSKFPMTGPPMKLQKS